MSALDRAVLFGDGAFETLRAYNGVLFRLESHVERLRRSLQGIRIDLRLDGGAVRAAIEPLLQANRLANARVRYTVTGGVSDGSFRLVRGNPPNVLITAIPIQAPSPEEYAQGISLAIAGFRQAWDSPLARLKTIHRLEYLIAREEALAAGADAALLLDDRGNLAECSSSNIFLFFGNTLVTAPRESPILAGVTREVAIEAGREAGFPVEERQVSVTELFAAAEVFVTSTSAEILAVRAVDGRPVGAGGRGERTARLHAAFRHIVRRETEKL